MMPPHGGVLASTPGSGARKFLADYLTSRDQSLYCRCETNDGTQLRAETMNASRKTSKSIMLEEALKARNETAAELQQAMRAGRGMDEWMRDRIACLEYYNRMLGRLGHFPPSVA
jgi:hypothetical protein